MAALAIALPLLGAVTSVIGSQQQGQAAQTNANAQALQLERNASNTRASAQREAINQERQTKFMMSRAQALAAASGGDTTDPTVVKNMGDIAGEGEYRRLTALFNGETQATGDEYQATVAQRTGQAMKQAANLKSLSTVLNTGSSFYERYGMPLRSSNMSDPGYADPDIAAGRVY